MTFTKISHALKNNLNKMHSILNITLCYIESLVNFSTLIQGTCLNKALYTLGPA